MKIHRAKIRARLTAATVMAALAGGAVAGPIPYPNPGTPNPAVYTFTAASTGEITAYFAGSGASYDEEVGLLVNGVPTGVVGLDDHGSSLGEALDLGAVTAGDTLTFIDDVFTTGNTWYSTPTLNVDGGNHVYSTSAAAGQVYSGSPAGTYVGFEDLEFPGSDFNYYDDTFIFTNTVTVSSIPEPAAWSMMLIGIAGVGALARRQTRRTAAA